MSKEQLKIEEAYKLWKWLIRKSERVQIELINVPYNIRFGINEILKTQAEKDKGHTSKC